MAKRYLFLHLDRSELASLQWFISRMTIQKKWFERSRGQAVWFSHQKMTVSQIALRVRVSERSVYKWLHAYQTNGLTGISTRAYRRLLTDEQIKQLMAISHWANVLRDPKELWQRWSFRKMARWVKDNFGIQISHERIRQIINLKLRGI